MAVGITFLPFFEVGQQPHQQMQQPASILRGRHCIFEQQPVALIGWGIALQVVLIGQLFDFGQRHGIVRCLVVEAEAVQGFAGLLALLDEGHFEQQWPPSIRVFNFPVALQRLRIICLEEESASRVPGGRCCALTKRGGRPRGVRIFGKFFFFAYVS